MKNLKIKISLILVLFMLFSINTSSYTEKSQNIEEDYTMEEIEQMLEEYLKEYNANIEVGSKEYVNYLVLQLMEDSDEKLAMHDRYDDIRVYASVYLSEVDRAQSRGELTAEMDSFVLDYSTQNKTLSDIKNESIEQEILDAEIQRIPQVYRAAYYEADAAARYAIRWGEGRNREYNSHFKDCTNFVSQAVEAGGINQDSPSYVPTGITDTVSRWYSIKYDEWHGNNSVYRWKESSSWIGVEDFYTYSIRNGARSYICDSFRDLENRARIGDVVQLKNSNGRWYHSIMITGESRGELLYSGHTNDHSNEVLRDTGERQYRIIRY